MKNYKIIIQYDGTRYNGWQKQHNTKNTIQARLELVLSKMVGREIEVIGSGRTDAGVHAYGQVANFHLNSNKTPIELMNAVNQYLPDDIAIVDISVVPEEFHSRFHATAKKYVYRLWNKNIPNVFERKYLFSYHKQLDMNAMKQAAQYLIGEHDFKAFCTNKRLKKSTVRTIYSIDFVEKEGELQLWFYGNGFLYNMIRIITGTLLEIGEGKKMAEDIPEILIGKDREKAGFTAPPHGLALMEVDY